MGYRPYAFRITSVGTATIPDQSTSANTLFGSYIHSLDTYWFTLQAGTTPELVDMINKYSTWMDNKTAGPAGASGDIASDWLNYDQDFIFKNYQQTCEFRNNSNTDILYRAFQIKPRRPLPYSYYSGVGSGLAETIILPTPSKLLSYGHAQVAQTQTTASLNQFCDRNINIRAIPMFTANYQILKSFTGRIKPGKTKTWSNKIPTFRTNQNIMGYSNSSGYNYYTIPATGKSWIIQLMGDVEHYTSVLGGSALAYTLNTFMFNQRTKCDLYTVQRQAIEDTYEHVGEGTGAISTAVASVVLPGNVQIGTTANTV